MQRSSAQAGVQFRRWDWTPACAGERLKCIVSACCRQAAEEPGYAAYRKHIEKGPEDCSPGPDFRAYDRQDF